MKTLNDLHTGLKFLKKFSEYAPLISKQAAMSLDEDEHGIVDISAASKPTYSNDIMDFGQNRQYRMYIDRHTYTPPSGNTISYMALILCKRKSESSKKKTTKGNKSGDDEDYFQIVIPVSRLDHLLIAVEMAMENNNIKPVEIIENSEMEKKEMEKKKKEEEEEEEPMDDQNEEEGDDVDDDEEVMVVEKKKKKKKHVVKKRKRTLSPESDTDVADSDDDRSEADSGSSTDVDMEEEKRKKRRTGRVIKKNKKYD